MKTNLIVALDDMDCDRALEISNVLSNVLWVKVGPILMLETPSIIRELKKMGKKVFVDLKFHDIPSTVYQAVKKTDELGADIITIHTSGGRDMMEAAKDGAKNAQIFGVTVLTSMSRNDCIKIFLTPPDETVIGLVTQSVFSGLNGIVCSVNESRKIKDIFPSISVICPGIRPKWWPKDDQTRTSTPREAKNNGVDYIVVGRPITKNVNPFQAAQYILEELS